MELKNTIALVTGANRGIGQALVDALRNAGVKKIYAAARDTATLSEVVAGDGGRTKAVKLDVTDPEQVRAVAELASDVTLLINNAGVAIFGGFITTGDLEGARREMDVNYFGTLAMSRAFAPVLKRNGGGAIVNIASIAAQVNFPIIGPYSASKAAVHSMTQGLRAELSNQNTQVIGVYPGPVDTDMTKNFDTPKVPPALIAEAVLKAIAEGTEDVYPDPMAAEIHGNLLHDPKAVEKQFGEMRPE